MCGIAGFYAFKDAHWKLNKKALAVLLEDIQERGPDATGYATITTPGGDIWSGKAPVKVKPFVDKFLMRADVPVGYAALLHTRSATIGPAHDNINNHPLIWGGVAAVHNGTVGDVEKVYKHFEVERYAMVDSAIIPVILSKLGVEKGLEWMTDNVAGTAAIAAIIKGNGSLLLARDTKPLYVAHFPDKGLVWSSDSDSLLKLSTHKILGFTCTMLSEMENGSYINVSHEGKVLSSGEFMMKSLPARFHGYYAGAEWAGVDYGHPSASPATAKTETPGVRPTNTCEWGGCTKIASVALAIGSQIKWSCKKHRKAASKGVAFPGGP